MTTGQNIFSTHGGLREHIFPADIVNATKSTASDLLMTALGIDQG